MASRPLAISAVCVLGAIAALITAALLAMNSLWVVPPTAGQRILGFAALVATSAGLFGMWRMRRWGVLLIATLLGGRIIFGLVTHGTWSAAAMPGPLVVLVLGAIYWKRMS